MIKIQSGTGRTARRLIANGNSLKPIIISHERLLETSGFKHTAAFSRYF
jgi:hypothetical protein